MTEMAAKIEIPDWNIWGDEDGDRYFADGHIEAADETAFFLAILAYAADLDFDLSHLVEMIPRLQRATVRRYWARPASEGEDEERMTICVAHAPGAQPYTEVILA